MREARRFVVTGRVQGVFFRGSTRQVAESLQITGHAINKPDGTVEVLAYGEPAALDRLSEWLKEGPPMASVRDVESEVVDWRETPGFTTR